jgi:iron(III) transport system permease protein
MAYQNSRAFAGGWGWTVMALAIIGIVLAPILSILWLALTPAQNIWPHLLDTVLPRYLGNTLALIAGVGVLAALIGTGAAWLVTFHDFPGRRWLSHLLLVPLAIPAYVAAYAMVDVLDYPGAVQTALRAAFGWTSARDYWFPEVRSLPGATVVLALALYPYVYLLARTAFQEAGAATVETARALGCGPWAAFWRVALPMARPAIATGIALVSMEVVADYGTVAHFGVQTLTTGIFSTWLNGGNAGGAAQIAGLALSVILILVLVERLGRRGARFHGLTRAMRPVQPVVLRGWRAAAASGAAALPVLLGAVLPVGVMAALAMDDLAAWVDPGLAAALLNTLVVAVAATALTVGAALGLVMAVRLGAAGRLAPLLPLTTLGYAAPGTVLALGLLIPMAAVDHGLADTVVALTGHDPGLILTGTATAIVLALSLRFFGIAQGAVDAAQARVASNLTLAARSLGEPTGGVVARVHLPLMRGSVAMAALIVFVDCVKELPATLLLRPFNFNTLSTRVYELASLERLSEAAPAALVVMAVGLVPVVLIARLGR